MKKNIKIGKFSVVINDTEWFFSDGDTAEHIMDCIRMLYKELKRSNTCKPKDTVLAVEIKYYEKNKKKFLKYYKNKYVLIKNNKFLGSFDTQENAYKEGLSKLGNVPMFIRKVVEKEPIVYV